MNSNDPDNAIPPTVVFIERATRKKGYTDFIRDLKIGEVKCLGDYNPNGAHSIARNVGYTVRTALDPASGKVYVRRES